MLLDLELEREAGRTLIVICTGDVAGAKEGVDDMVSWRGRVLVCVGVCELTFSGLLKVVGEELRPCICIYIYTN